jgi:nucleoside-diphosphate-sugar epimerase
MRVLVTGSDGYIGAVLVSRLLNEGIQTVGLDAGFYRSGLLYRESGERPHVIARDIRDVRPRDLVGFDAVVHLAELSNDPLGQFNPETTYSINRDGSANIMRCAREAGVSRFIYASSCSVYGIGTGKACSETDRTFPQTVYAECKLLSEGALLELAGPGFCVTSLRNATAFGASPRMRFDIVLNNLAGLAWTTGQIALTSDGSPLRPLVHVEDIADAIVCTLRAPVRSVSGQIFNVGDDEQNYSIRDIAGIVAETFPGCDISFGSNGADNRSYRVSFAKIRRHLPDFRCRWTAADGARQLRRVFEHIGLSTELFEAAPFTRLRQLQALIEARQMDRALRWTECRLDHPARYPEIPAA